MYHGMYPDADRTCLDVLRACMYSFQHGPLCNGPERLYTGSQEAIPHAQGEGRKKMVSARKPIGQLLTPVQVAERLQFSKRTILEWLRQGKIPGVKIRQKWRISEEDLVQF